MLLLGSWITFKKIDANGNDVTESVNMTYDFNPYGRGKNRISPTTLPPHLSSWEINWQILNDRLSITVHHPMAGDVHLLEEYWISNDTLLIKNNGNGKLIYWKRR
jgi:hypothetical protein